MNDTETVENPPYTSESFGEFIAGRRWQFAKSMPLMPHEYTIRNWRPDHGDVRDFLAAVVHIRIHGQKETFQGRTYLYLYHDGWKYWTMGDTLERTIVLNRARVQP